MKSKSTSKLTNTMLTQLQENEYLRVKLIQLQKISRQKDNFYLSIFREQEKITEKVMSELLLAEEKIKQFVRERICNNWKEEYDSLAGNISSYVKDVNGLIEEYQQTKHKLQQKTYKTNDLYDYYSNTLEECGKKFDQAQMIIQELNSKIDELKDTIIDMDENIEHKMRVIEEQNREIQQLHDRLNEDNEEVDILKQTHEADMRTIEGLRKIIKKLEKDNEAVERSNQELGRMVNSLGKQDEEKTIKISQMEEDLIKLHQQIKKFKEANNQAEDNIYKLQQQVKNLTQMKDWAEQSKEQSQSLVEKLSQIIKGQKQKITELETELKKKDLEIQILQYKKAENDLKKQEVQFVSMFDKSNNLILPNGQKQNHSILNFSQTQLHLKKILEQQETINGLILQLTYSKKTIENLQRQNHKLIDLQMNYISQQNAYKKQIVQIKQKVKSLTEQICLKEEEIHAIKLNCNRDQQETQDWKLQVEGLYEEIANRQKELCDLQKHIHMLQKQIQTLHQNNNQLNQANHENLGTIQILKKDKLQSKQNFQNLLQQFQEFVKESEVGKQPEILNRKQALSLCSFQINETLIIQDSLVVSREFSKMKKKNLLINVQQSQTVREKQREGLKDLTIQNEKQNLTTRTVKTKKFNLQNFQQKTNPHLNLCFSPKVGQIYNAIHQGRIGTSYRW